MIKNKVREFRFEDNAFDIIRYWAAISVMLGHYAWKIQSFSDNGKQFMVAICKISVFFPGVVVLFSLSGYLVAASYERSKSPKDYFVRRVLRMYPELWVCTLVNLICIVIMAYNMLDRTILLWIGTQFFGIANTPSCLSDFATGSVNGALWTIFTELQLYVVLGCIYKWIKKFDVKKWIFLFLFLIASNILTDFFSQNMSGIAGEIIGRLFLPYALWFFIGVFCYINREYVLPVLKKATVPLLIIYTILYFIPVDIPGYYTNIAIGLLLPLIVIGGGYFLPKMRFSTDLSYEIFLYHWIVLNIMVHYDLINRWSWWVCLMIFILGTFALSWISWRYVGKGRRNKIQDKISIH